MHGISFGFLTRWAVIFCLLMGGLWLYEDNYMTWLSTAGIFVASWVFSIITQNLFLRRINMNSARLVEKNLYDTIHGTNHFNDDDYRTLTQFCFHGFSYLIHRTSVYKIFSSDVLMMYLNGIFTCRLICYNRGSTEELRNEAKYLYWLDYYILERIIEMNFKEEWVDEIKEEFLSKIENKALYNRGNSLEKISVNELKESYLPAKRQLDGLGI